MANLNDFQEQLDILSATKTSIKEAIIGKGQEVSSEDSFSSYADKIDDIVTLEEGTADADATAQDIAYNKTAYVNGTKVTGSIETIGPNEKISGMLMDATTVQKTTIYDEHDNPYPGIQYTFLASGNTLTRDGADVSTNAKYSDIVSALSGTADRISADKILSGETILGVSGTATSDADATASDILYSKTAYVNGQKVAGRMMKHVGDSTYANQLSAPDNTDHFNMYYTSANDKIYIGNFKIGSGYWDGTASSNAYIDKNLVYTKLGLTANKLKVGESVLGVQGTFTSDANATASDILSSKTAYVNGQKVTGTISSIGWGFNEAQLGDMSLNNNMIYINPVVSQTSGFYTPGVQAKITTSYSNIATLIGLSADKIKQGETILGITGNVIELNGETKTITPTTSQQAITPSQDKNAITEVTVNAVTSAIDSNIQAENIKNGVTILGITGTAQVIKEYSTYQEIEQALLDGDIETGDIVLCGGTYTFYLCEMNTETGDSYLEKLVKESETISPSDYTEAEEQIGDLFGEEENN